MKLFFLLILTCFGLISAKNATKPRLFPLKPSKVLPKSNQTSRVSEEILTNSRIPLVFSTKDGNVSLKVRANSSDSQRKSEALRNNSVVFKRMRYRAPDLPYVLSPEDENFAVNAENNEDLANNDENFQAFYSSYFRKYYENLQNTYNNREETPGSMYINPNRNVFFPANSQKTRFFRGVAPRPYAKVLKIQEINGGNPCVCENPATKFCDCDEIDAQSQPIALKPIVLPIIQPIMQRVPLQIAPGQECFEADDDCLCGNREDPGESRAIPGDFHENRRKNRCKCPCGGKSGDFAGKYRENEENVNGNNRENAENPENRVNINSANANNANILAQKNTLNKIGNVYAANYSTVNYNHHVHNYINGADFKFKQNFSRENCEKNDSSLQYFPNIVILNKIDAENAGNSEKMLKITTKVDKNEIAKLAYRQNSTEIDENKENFTGVMNQAVENTILSIKRRRLLRKNL